VHVLVGSVIIAWSGIFVRLAGLSPTTSAFLRCAYAVPVLALLAWGWRRTGRSVPLDARRMKWAVLAGASFGADLVLWHVSIGAVGAGLATVLGNTQVVLFPLAAWLVWGERPSRRQVLVLPLLVIGIVLIAGVIGASSFGDDPALGAITGVLTGVAYAGFLMGMRGASPAAGGVPIEALTIATFVAGFVAAACGLVAGNLHPAPSWPAHGWMLLLAWSCQVLAWMLISGSLTKVRAARVSILLLVQPVTALLLSVAVLSEAPSAWQWIGSAMVLAGVLLGGGRLLKKKSVASPVGQSVE